MLQAKMFAGKLMFPDWYIFTINKFYQKREQDIGLNYCIVVA